MRMDIEYRDNLSYLSAGVGDETILWVHGYTMDARIWEEIWERLPGWRHIGINLPGHGTSAPAKDTDNLVSLARRLGGLAMEFGARHLVGLSFGGMIACQIAIEFPDLPITLTLGSPALGGGPQDRHAQTRNLELMELYRKKGVGPWLSELWMQSPPDIFKGAEKNPKLFASLKTIISEHRWAELADSGMQRFVAYAQTESELHKIKACTLILVGDEDMQAFKRSAQIINRSVTSSRRCYVPNAGHLTLLEQPNLCAELIREHLESVAGQ